MVLSRIFRSYSDVTVGWDAPSGSYTFTEGQTTTTPPKILKTGNIEVTLCKYDTFFFHHTIVHYDKIQTKSK